MVLDETGVWNKLLEGVLWGLLYVLSAIGGVWAFITRRLDRRFETRDARTKEVELVQRSHADRIMRLETQREETMRLLTDMKADIKTMTVKQDTMLEVLGKVTAQIDK